MTDREPERETSGNRAREVLSSSGLFSSATELLRSDPNAELVALARRVPGLTAWDLSQLLRLETRPEDLAWLARRILVGELRRNLAPDGWPSVKTHKSVMPYIRAFSSWKGLLGRDLEAGCDAVASWLKAGPPPAGWLPDSVDDPLLARAFEVWTE